MSGVTCLRSDAVGSAALGTWSGSSSHVRSVDYGGGRLGPPRYQLELEGSSAGLRADHIRAAQKAAPAVGTEYEYLSGPVLLRVSQALTPDEAAAYQKALG